MVIAPGLAEPQDIATATIDRENTKVVRVAMMIHRFHPHLGGAETQLKQLIPHLRSQGVGIDVIAREEPPAPTRDVVDGARVYRTPLLRGVGAGSLSYTLRAMNYLMRNRSRIDVIHAHGLLSPSTTALLAKVMLGKPVVITTHGFAADLHLLQNGAFGAQRLWALALMADRFVVISDEIGNGLQSCGVAPERLVRISNGVDTERFSPASPAERARLRAELGLGNAPVAVFVGRIEPVKGADYLLDAWPAVTAHVPAARLLIIGDGSARAELESRHVRGVEFLGSRADPLPYFQASNCFVLPSRSEGLPVALLESMSVGLRPVSMRVGGAPEVLRGFEDQSLVDPGDVSGLSAKLIGALSTCTTTDQSLAFRKRIIRSYSVGGTAKSLASLYRTLVSERVSA